MSRRSFQCECVEGFNGNGTHCAVGNGTHCEDCQEGYLGNGTLCEDIDECKLSRWIRWVLWKLRFHHKLKPPRTTTAPENDTTTTTRPQDTDPISSTPKPADEPGQDNTVTDPCMDDEVGTGTPGTGPIVELMDWSTEELEQWIADSFFDVFTEVSIDVGQIVDANSSRPVQVVALLQRTAYRELFPPERGLLDSFFDVFYEIETGNASLPDLCRNGTCVNTHGSFVCERCNCSQHPHACSAHGSVHCPDPWQHCHELHPSTCVETATGKCECVCGVGQHAHPAPHATPALTNWAEPRMYCADDTCNCSRHRRCATEQDAHDCGPTGCWPRKHCWRHAAGTGLETVCRTLHAATCKEMVNNETNRSDCQCICPPGYVAHPFPAGGGGTLADVSTAGELMQSFNSASQGDGTRHWLWFCMDVDECHGFRHPRHPQHPCGGEHKPHHHHHHHHHHHQHHHGGHEWLGEALPGPVGARHNCDRSARCHNTPGSFECECPDGAVGNGTHCELGPPAFTSLTVLESTTWPSVGDVLVDNDIFVSFTFNVSLVAGSSINVWGQASPPPLVAERADACPRARR